MRIIVRISCVDKEEFDRGEQMICEILKRLCHDDIINANLYIAGSEVTKDAEE